MCVRRVAAGLLECDAFGRRRYDAVRDASGPEVELEGELPGAVEVSTGRHRDFGGRAATEQSHQVSRNDQTMPLIRNVCKHPPNIRSKGRPVCCLTIRQRRGPT